MAKCDVCGQEILKASGCSVKDVVCNGVRYSRIKFGDEGWGNPVERCPDCGCLHGYCHHWGCDIERCPSCGGQMFGCFCEDVYIEMPVSSS